jgi:capsular polysaccharide biosynthesis protein
MGRGNDSLERILAKLIEKEDVFYEEQTGNIYFVKDLIELPEIKNKTIFFHGDWNLYHLILETSPGLLLINDTDYKINLSYSSKQNTDVVKVIGNPYIIPTKLFSLEKFSELIIPSPILEDNAHFPNIELMNKLIKKLQINFLEKTKIKPLGKKIYVSRSDASRRKVLNEVELMEHLEKRGFKMVIPRKYNIADQSKLFEDAEIIIGPHGMGLTNILFSNNLKTVIELFPTTWYPNCYLRTAQIKGAKNYYGLFYDADDPNTKEIFKILDELEK